MNGSAVQLNYLLVEDVRDHKVFQVVTVGLLPFNSVAAVLLVVYGLKSSMVKVFIYGSFAGHQWNPSR